MAAFSESARRGGDAPLSVRFGLFSDLHANLPGLPARGFGGRSMEDLARGLERFRETGVGTVRETIEEARLAHVCERLRSSDAPVDAVAAECGFASTAHLAVSFRRTFGLSMARWRAQHRAGGSRGFQDAAPP